MNPQAVQKALKFRESILALDRYAQFSVDGNTLQVIHSKCGGKSMQKAINDISNFKEHVGICQGPYTSDRKSPLKSSLRGGSASSIDLTTVTLARPAQLTCPGFSFEEIFGKSYESLPSHQREQVTRAAKVAGLRLLHSEKNSSVTSEQCSKKNPSHQKSMQPCYNCSKDLGQSNFKDALRPKTPGRVERYSPFRSIDIKTIGAGEDRSYECESIPRSTVSNFR